MIIGNKKYILLTVILCVSLFLRIYDLSDESIWIDEGWSMRFAKLKIADIFFLKDTNPPLYYLFLHGWMNWFGDSEFSIRLPSAIFAFLSVTMIYKVGVQLFNKEVGLLSALMLGLSAFHLYYSQEARAYSLLVLLTLLSMYFFIRFFRQEDYRTLVQYIFFSILLMYSHIYGAFIIFGQNIYFFTKIFLSKEMDRLRLRRWVLSQLVLVSVFALWLPVLFSTVSESQNGFHKDFLWTLCMPKPSIKTLIDSVIEYSGLSLFFPYILLALFSIMTCEKIGESGREKNLFRSVENCQWKVRLSEVDKIYLLWIWMLSPIIVPFIISRVSVSFYKVRYTIPAAIAFYLLVARGINNIRHNRLKIITIAIVVIFSSVYVVKYYVRVTKEPWRDIAGYVDARAEDMDIILFNRGLCQELLFDYYSKNPGLVKSAFPKETRFVNEENIKELGPVVKGYNRVWVILSHTGDRKGLIVRTLGQSHNLSCHKRYRDKGIDIYIFETAGIKRGLAVSAGLRKPERFGPE